MALLHTLRSRLKAFRRRQAEQDAIATCVSYPKAGRTWLRVMLDELDLPLAWKHDGSQHTRAIPWSEYSPCSGSYGDYRGQRLLLLYRDPRDTAVSGFFQRSRRREQGYAGTVGDFLRDPCHGLEKIARFNMAWLQRGDSHGLPFAAVSYEGLRLDTAGGLGRIVTFLAPDQVISAATLSATVEQCSFSTMQERERSGSLAARYGERLRPADPGDTESFKVRRGKVGGYVDYLDEADQHWCQETLTALGYDRCLEENRSRVLI